MTTIKPFMTVKDSEARGAEQFALGMMRIATLDVEWYESLDCNTINREFAAHATAWLKGWDKANLAAPLE